MVGDSDSPLRHHLTLSLLQLLLIEVPIFILLADIHGEGHEC